MLMIVLPPAVIAKRNKKQCAAKIHGAKSDGTDTWVWFAAGVLILSGASRACGEVAFRF